MKHLKWLFFIILIITLNCTAFALNLDVDNELNDFAKENLFDKGENQNLNNPFFLKEEAAETPEEDMGEVVEPQTPTNPTINTVEKRQVNIEPEPIVVEPEIVINGIISASESRLALLITYQQERHLLEIGESIDNYKLTSYKNGEATFIKNGREIKVSY